MKNSSPYDFGSKVFFIPVTIRWWNCKKWQLILVYTLFVSKLKTKITLINPPSWQTFTWIFHFKEMDFGSIGYAKIVYHLNINKIFFYISHIYSIYIFYISHRRQSCEGCMKIKSILTSLSFSYSISVCETDHILF